MRLNRKFLVFVLFVSLIPISLLSVSSMDALNEMEAETSDSVDTIREIIQERSDESREATVSASRSSLIGLLKENLASTRDQKIEKYSAVLRSVETQARVQRGIVERRWDELPVEKAKSFDGMVWVGPENQDRYQYRDSIAKLTNLGVSFQEIESESSLISLAYYGTNENVVMTSTNIRSVLEKAGSFSAVERPWYRAAERKASLTWTKPYVDITTKTLTTTVAAPAYSEGELMGVVGMDVYLDTMKKDILETDPGFSFLLDSDGEVVVYPGMEAPNKTEYAERTFEGRNLVDGNVSEEVRKLGENMTEGVKGVSQIKIGNRTYYVAYGPLETNNWSVAIARPSKKVVDPVNDIQSTISSGLKSMRSQIDEETSEVNQNLNEKINNEQATIGGLIAFMIILILGCGVYFSHRVTEPIVRLRDKAESISKGAIGEEVDINTGDEIEELADSFNRVIRTIKVLQKRDSPGG